MIRCISSKEKVGIPLILAKYSFLRSHFPLGIRSCGESVLIDICVFPIMGLEKVNVSIKTITDQPTAIEYTLEAEPGSTASILMVT